MSLSQMAMLAAQFPKEKIKPHKQEYASDRDDYSGVIITDGDYRLAVSPQGQAYLPQMRRDGAWHCSRPFADRASLSFHLEVIDAPWPEGILAVLADLPGSPADCIAARPSEKDAG